MRQGIVIKITTLPTKLRPVPTVEKVALSERGIASDTFFADNHREELQL
jgi:hypothetical protein